MNDFNAEIMNDFKGFFVILIIALIIGYVLLKREKRREGYIFIFLSIAVLLLGSFRGTMLIAYYEEVIGETIGIGYGSKTSIEQIKYKFEYKKKYYKEQQPFPNYVSKKFIITDKGRYIVRVCPIFPGWINQMDFSKSLRN